jgi:hypothetical protein
LCEDILAKFDFLINSKYIQKVDLSSNKMDPDFVLYISLASEDNSSVTYLNLANNAMQSDGADYLIGILDLNTMLAVGLSTQARDTAQQKEEEEHANTNPRRVTV